MFRRILSSIRFRKTHNYGDVWGEFNRNFYDPVQNLIYLTQVHHCTIAPYIFDCARWLWRHVQHGQHLSSTRSSATAKSTARPSCLVGLLRNFSGGLCFGFEMELCIGNLIPLSSAAMINLRSDTDISPTLHQVFKVGSNISKFGLMLAFASKICKPHWERI